MSCIIKRIITLKEAIQYTNIKVFDPTKEVTNESLYSWSTDGVCWTGWTNLDNYNNICSKLEGDFYLRILIYGGFDKLMLGDSYTKCYNICLDSSTDFLQDFCGQENLFQPYSNLDCALELQQQLADSVVCMFGIPIYYFRVNPINGATDYTFKEHYLHQIESVKQLKLMIADGQMPSSNPKLTEMDFDWEIDWETEISKTQFATAFGDTAYPKTGDFIYIPMMKRMWEVNAAYDEKNEGLMWRSTTWKLALVKYSESTNVDNNNFDDIIDNLTQTYEEVFGEVERNEQMRETGASPLSTPPFAATNLYDIFMEDSVRKQYTKQDITIADKQYNNKATVVARNIYKPKNENGCITYQKPICGDSGTLMFIIETGGFLDGELKRDIVNFGEVQVSMSFNMNTEKFGILFNNLKYEELEQFKSYLVVINWNRSNYSSELHIYNYVHREDLPIYRLRPEMYWFDFENPVCSLVGMYNNDFDMRNKLECKIHPYPFMMTNIKYYNAVLDNVEIIKESVKYTTKHENCVINDIARPIILNHGYAVK